jgi:hypothetical protein
LAAFSANDQGRNALARKDQLRLIVTSRGRHTEVGMRRYNDLLRADKLRHPEIAELERRLPSTKFTTLDDVEEYLRIRGEVAPKLYKFYNRSYWHRLQWRMHQRRDKWQHGLVNKLKSTFGGNDLVIAWGMGTQNSYHLPIRGSPPSPQRKLRDFLAHFFPVVCVGEYMTTKTCCHCLNETEAFVDKDGKAVHGLRVCRNGEKSKPTEPVPRIFGYLHRDINAAINIRARFLKQCQLV